jgi:hypothetical protein
MNDAAAVSGMPPGLVPSVVPLGQWPTRIRRLTPVGILRATAVTGMIVNR